jgi:cell division protein FtsQ
VHSEHQTRERIERGTIFAAVVIALGLFGLALYWLIRFTADRFFYHNPDFALTQIEVETDGHLTRDQIVNLAGIRRGQSVFEVNLPQAKRDLELDPLIECAEVAREMPSRIRIVVTERVPLAQICVQPFGRNKSRLHPIVFYVDKHGVAMQAYTLKSPRLLPALTGVRLADLRVGKPIQSAQVFAALELVRQMELSRVGARLEVERIDLSRADALTAVTRNGETIAFDPQRVTQGLRRLGIILADVERSGMALSTVDLTVQQNVPVTVRPPNSGRGEANL